MQDMSVLLHNLTARFLNADVSCDVKLDYKEFQQFIPEQFRSKEAVVAEIFRSVDRDGNLVEIKPGLSFSVGSIADGKAGG